MIALIDYGVGNLRSVNKALQAAGADVTQTDDPQVILSASKVVLPGVGAFQDGMQGLTFRKLVSVIHAVFVNQTPLLGICLGMQLLFDSSSERGQTTGLGLIHGSVEQFATAGVKIPQTGWNQIELKPDGPLFHGVESGAYVYFNHSYYCKPETPGNIIGTTKYGRTYASAVQKGSLYGVQFHPEKSQRVGIKILKNFVERC